MTSLPIFIFSDDYNLDLGPHVFPAVKFGHIYRALREDSRFADHTFVRPGPATREQVSLAHSRNYIQDLISLQRSARTYRSELPLTAEIVDAFFLSTGGTIEAARQAMQHGRAMNLGGGFHHSYRGHAEGFCYLNDVAVAIKVLQKEKHIKRALVVDLDVHQGNGTARMFRFNRNVYTFSMHEQDNYPIKERGSYDLGLRTGCRDEEYLALLGDALERIQNTFHADIVFYLAGVDVYERDRLGGLSLTSRGVAERDRMVRDFARDLPLVTVLAGGYAYNDEDTVRLHLQTCEVLADLI
ncbi:MAG: histone deacetylase [Leptospiraceae bacterium]|nr:histone deacetylase [Leptospiraceae bacterium]MCB1323089.1 histone deacetylase [Leptospiraceae bacterium]